MSTGMPDVDERPGLLRALWAQRRLSAAVIAGFSFLGIIIGLVSSPGVTASATVGVDDPRIAQASALPNSDIQSRFVADQAAFAGSDEVLQQAALDLDVPLAEVRDRVSTEPDAAVNTFSVLATAADAEIARETGDAVVAAYRQASSDRYRADAEANLQALEQARRDILDQLTATPDLSAESVSGALSDLADRSVAVRVRAETVGDGVQFSDPARVVQLGPLSRPEVRNALVGIALGAIVASVLALAGTDQPRDKWGRTETELREFETDAANRQSRSEPDRKPALSLTVAPAAAQAVVSPTSLPLVSLVRSPAPSPQPADPVEGRTQIGVHEQLGYPAGPFGGRPSSMVQ